MIPQLVLHLPEVRTRLARFIRDEIAAAGMEAAVIGLSGGIDSAVVAALAVDALGADRVLCVMLPYRSSSPRSIEDAARVAAQLGVRVERIDISTIVDAVTATDPEMNVLRKGNVMARARMIVLYDRSARDRALVVGTGNKTETLLGYCTLFGDAAWAINPIANLYKTQVWALAAELGIPGDIIAKPPSADLWEGQTDEGELGFTYRRVDELLHFLVDEQRGDADLEAMGFERAFIESVRRRMDATAFKRRAPLVASIR